MRADECLTRSHSPLDITNDVISIDLSGYAALAGATFTGAVGGRGTYASGNNVPYKWRTDMKIDGIKVLVGLEGQHKLPEESHSSGAYALLNRDGTLEVLRFYDGGHNLHLEIAYHNEAKLARRAGIKDGAPILHYHMYDKNFVRTDADFLTPDMRKRYPRLFGRKWK